MKIHILGIAGKTTTPLAIELKKHGHIVTGSDQKLIYPPASTLLAKNHLKINQTKIDKNIDLVIVGSSYTKFSNTKKEYLQAKKLDLPIISATKYIAKNIVKDQSIIVAGSHGKTTITSLLSLILNDANLYPSLLIGGTPINKINPVTINQSDWSVVEGDESINGLDKMAKFLYFKTKYVIITSLNWEHKDSYKTQKDNLNAYKKLIKNIPKDGILVYNQQDQQLKKLIKYCQSLCLPYNYDLKFQTKLIGDYNRQNITAAYTLAKYLKISDKQIKKSIKKYQGVARRLQIIAKHKNIIFIDDFAQSPHRINSSLQALRSVYPNRPIKLFFEPHASFLLYKKSIVNLKKYLKHSQQIVIAKIPYQKTIDKKLRTTAKDFIQELGNKAIYLPLYQHIKRHYQNNLYPGDILIHMSSGGQIGLKTFKSIIAYFKKSS